MKINFIYKKVLALLIGFSALAALGPNAWGYASSEGTFYIPSAQLDNAIKLDPLSHPKIKPALRATEDVATIRVNIAAGSEKQAWMEAMVAKWVKENRNKLGDKPIDIVIHPKGSIEAADEILNGSTDYQVWSPAASKFRDYVESGFSGKIFDTDSVLVKSPLVFATFADSQRGIDAEVKKPMSFDTIAQVFDEEFKQKYSVNNEKGGYKFDEKFQFKADFTKPDKSNSGLTALILMAYEFFGEKKRIRKIVYNDLSDKEFQDYLNFMKGSVSNSRNSTADLANDLAGSIRNYDSALIYENMAIDEIRFKPALVIRYPKYNMIADHPYYVLTNGSTQEQMDAARLFMEYLLERPQQMDAMEPQFGFRPGSTEISDEEIAKHFGQFQVNGLVLDIRGASIIVNDQSADVIRGLLYLYKNLPGL